jgi:hypothetical protein
LADFTADPVPLYAASPALVHKGFLVSMGTLYKEILRAIDEIRRSVMVDLEAGRGSEATDGGGGGVLVRVCVTGHSLGAAQGLLLCTLAASEGLPWRWNYIGKFFRFHCCS